MFEPQFSGRGIDLFLCYVKDMEEKEIKAPNSEIGNMKKDEKGKKIRKKRSTISIAAEFFIKVGITVLIVAILLIFVMGVYVVHSNSEYPMLKDGDLCFTYKLEDLSTGDEIVYKKDDKVYFGRIVAVEGDRVEILDGKLMVNGYGIYENAVYPTTAEGSKIVYPYEVPQDTVFVLNDYRNDINDSRCFGGIPVSDTHGKVVLVIRRRGI